MKSKLDLRRAKEDLKIAIELIDRELTAKKYSFDSTAAAIWIAEGDILDALVNLDQFFGGTRETVISKLKRLKRFEGRRTL